MSNYRKGPLIMGLLFLGSALPLTAQVGYGLEFTTPFPFYVGQTKMPAGSYTLTEPDDLDFHLITVRSTDDLHAASTWVIDMQSSQPPLRTVVVFEKYGDTLFLDKVLIDGDTSGVMSYLLKPKRRRRRLPALLSSAP